MGHRALAALAAAMLVLCWPSIAAASPGDHCASMPAEQTAPEPLRSAALRFFPWIRPAASSLHSGPFYLVALSSRTAISRDGDPLDSSSFYLHRALIAVAPSYQGQVVVSGRRLGTSALRARLGFSTTGATACTVSSVDVFCKTRPLRFASALTIPTRSGWRIVQTELRIGRTGCFALTASGRNLHAVIPLAVPGPDYGTAGW